MQCASRRVFRAWLAGLVFMCCPTLASAVEKSFTLQNRSGETITSVKISGAQLEADITIQANIAAGESGDIVIDLPEDQCIFTLAYVLISQNTIQHANVDLCNVDGIVVE